MYSGKLEDHVCLDLDLDGCYRCCYHYHLQLAAAGVDAGDDRVGGVVRPPFAQAASAAHPCAAHRVEWQSFLGKLDVT